MKNVNLSLFTVFFLLIIGSIAPIRLSAQDRCSTPPLSESQKQAFEDWMQQSLQAYHRQPAAERAVFTIPVIVHIVHSNVEPVGVGDNIAQERVISQLEVLNEDFRRRPNTPGFNNHPAGADVEIEFCLADRAPDGSLLPEPGIDRVNRNLKGWVAPPYSQDYAARVIRPGSIWDPYRYFNIWVCDLSGNTLGFAEYPVDSGLDGLSGVTTNDSNDGVVISTNSFGRDPSSLPAPYNLGRSTTHEVGHWLGLFHIWGDASCGDDFCGDTPTAEDAHYGCPRDPFSCNSIDMYENYMDYTDDRCMNVFTTCQRERMRAALLNGKRRKELLSSDACTPIMEPPTAELGSDNQQGCPGLIVRFDDLSSNRPNAWAWSFPGGTPTTSQDANPIVVYNEIGTYDVQLISQNAYGADTLLLEDYIDIKRGTETTVFYKENFETGASGWTVENPDGRNGWELSFQSAGSQNGKGTMRMQCWDYDQIGERDYLISPAINLRDRYNISLQFDHAYRQSDEGQRDSLIIRVSTDDGATFPHRVFAEAENGRGSFATNPPLANDFLPLRDEDWCYGGDVGLSCISLDLNEFQGFNQLRLRFESYNAGGNSIFIDNIQLRGSCLPNKREDELVFRVFPNPTSGNLELEYYQESQAAMELSLLDLLGRKLWKSEFLAAPGDVNKAVRLEGIAPGTYFLQLRSAGASGVKKIVIW